MPDRSHFQRLRAIVSGFSALGVPVHVFTARPFQPEVERAGGTFVDLFSSRPLDAADAESMPMPCRLVSYAGWFAGQRDSLDVPAQTVTRLLARGEPL